MIRERIKALPGERLSKADLRRKVRQRLNGVGWLVYFTGAARFHDDGDTVAEVFRWWHPVSWMMVVIAFPLCAIVGVRIADSVPFRLTEYWRNNPEGLNWL